MIYVTFHSQGLLEDLGVYMHLIVYVNAPNHNEQKDSQVLPPSAPTKTCKIEQHYWKPTIFYESLQEAYTSE